MPAQIHSPTPVNLRRLATALQRGQLVAIPTETVYGLAANALNARACRAIFSAKGRPANDPLIVHVLDLAQAETLAKFNGPARQLAKKFWPGPLTLVLPKKSGVPGVVTSGGSTVALRSPAHPVTRRLLRLAGIPLAAPSANPFGYISPTTADHVFASLGRRISHILDGGPSAVGVESTILDLSVPERPRLLRPGVITAAQLEKSLGRPIEVNRTKGKNNERKSHLPAPGMLAQHYSPRTPLFLRLPDDNLPANTAAIFLRRPKGKKTPQVFWLSQRGSLAEIARNLYRVLREADSGNFSQLCLEPLPADATGLATAINDRLQRAAARSSAR